VPRSGEMKSARHSLAPLSAESADIIVQQTDCLFMAGGAFDSESLISDKENKSHVPVSAACDATAVVNGYYHSVAAPRSMPPISGGI
jgi:hypothetical protein